MANESEQPNANDSTRRGTEPLAQADRALRDTAQRYIDRAGMKVDLKKVEQRIRENPFSSAAIAAVSGFIVGGGLATRPGVALLALAARGAARETMTNAVSGKVRSMFR